MHSWSERDVSISYPAFIQRETNVHLIWENKRPVDAIREGIPMCTQWTELRGGLRGLGWAAAGPCQPGHVHTPGGQTQAEWMSGYYENSPG